MKTYFKLFRVPNLLIIAITMFFVKYCILKPLFSQMMINMPLSLTNFSLLVLSIVLISAAGYAINDYFDVKIDAINKPTKNVLYDKIPLRRAIILHWVLNILGVLIGAYVAFKVGMIKLSFIHIVMCFVLWYYSIKYKRIVLWGNIVIGILAAFIIILVWLYEFFALKADPASFANMLSSFKTINMFVFGYAFFAFIITVIREIIKDCQDIEGDKSLGCFTFPIAYGIQKAKKLIFWIIVIMIICVLVAQIKLYFWNMQYVYGYLMVTVQVLLVYILLKLKSAETSKDFAFLSNVAKIIMIAGILSMQMLYISF